MATDSIPVAADLRGGLGGTTDWRPIGPAVLKDIIRCVDAALRHLARRPDRNPVALLIEYGQQVIVGTGAVANPSTKDRTRSSRSIGAISPEPAMQPVDPSTAFGSATLDQLKSSLARGKPFAFLFLHRAQIGECAVGQNNEALSKCDDEAEDAHIATAVGYDDLQQAFIVVKYPNECAHEHDLSNAMLMSYAYVTHPILSQDVWTIRTLPTAT